MQLCISISIYYIYTQYMYIYNIRRPSGVLDESEVKPPFSLLLHPPKNAREKSPQGGGGPRIFVFSWRTPSLHEAALTLLGANSAVCRHTLHTFPLFAPKTVAAPPFSFPPCTPSTPPLPPSTPPPYPPSTPAYPLYPPFFTPKTCPLLLAIDFYYYGLFNHRPCL